MNTCRLQTVLSLTLSAALAFLAGCGSPEPGAAAPAKRTSFAAQKAAIAAPTCATNADCSDGIACTADACDPIAHTCSHDDSACPPTLNLTAPAAEAKVALASNGATGNIDFAFTTTKFPLGVFAGKVNCYLDGGVVGWVVASPYTFTGLSKGLHTLTCALADADTGVELSNPEARASVRVVAIAPCGSIADCDDGNPCSDQDCQQGQCVYSVYANCCAGAFECGGGEQCVGNGNAAKCSECALDIDCPSSDPCVTPTCDLSGIKGLCKFPKADPECCSQLTDACDDAKSCTADSCNISTGKCKHDLIAGTCCSAADCNDSDACTEDQCVNSQCVHGPDSLKPGCCHADAGCSDNNTCTVDKCDVVMPGYTMCSHAPDGSKPGCCNPPLTNCNDGNACTQDECVNFQCQFNAIADCCATNDDCGDTNVCTTHTCDPGTKKCVKTPLAGCCNADADCNDGKGCTTDVCNVGAHTCSHVTAANCCDSAADCNDGKVCTVDACVNGQCVNAPNSLLTGCCDSLADCEDDNSCTTDACTANKCVHTAVAGACTPAPVAPKILICPAAQVVPALTTQILPIKAKEVDPTKSLTFKLISAPSYITLPQASWSSNGAVYVSGLKIDPTSGNDAGSGNVSIEISNGTLTSTCNFGVTVTATGGYLIWKPTEVPSASADAIKTSIGKTGAYAQITTDLSLYPDLTQFKGVFVSLGVYGSGTPFHYLNPSEANTLKAYLAQKGRLYIEGGDTWADQGNPLAPQFGIIGVASATADLSGKINGLLNGSNVYTNAAATPPKTSYVFSYDSVDTLHYFNSDIDIIKADNQIGSHAVLTNAAGEVLQVAHDGGLYGYRTIGSSVMFGGMKASTDTADAMMARILNYFDNGMADTPANGICTPITCTAQDQCHTAGVCNPIDGTCSNPSKANGTACSDGNACTQTDTCQAGTCTGTSPVVCSAQDQCHTVGTCNPGTGTCSNPNKTDGTSCDDGNACTQTDACQAGTCTGASAIVCSAQDQCHTAGTCNPANGVCGNPAKANGTSCSDGNACTSADTCQGGTCTGGAAPNCDDGNACSTDACDTGSGCTHVNLATGASCGAGMTCNGSGTCAATGNVLFSESFPTLTGSPSNDVGAQCNTGKTLHAFADLPGWTKSGTNAVHVVELSAGNYAPMFYDTNQILMNTAVAANTAGITYTVAFKGGPAVYGCGQDTQAGSGLVFDVINPSDVVVGTYNYFPAVWAGSETLTPASFTYVGNGTGDVRLRIHDNVNDNRFGGTIDDITISGFAIPSAGLIAHYSAQDAATLTKDGSGNVSAWSDSSGSGHTMGPLGQAPVYMASGINGYPVVNFNNASLTSSPFVLTSELTVVVVLQWRTPWGWGVVAEHGPHDGTWDIEQNGAKGINVVHFQSDNDNSNAEVSLGTNGNYILVGRIVGGQRQFSAYDSSTNVQYSTGPIVSSNAGGSYPLLFGQNGGGGEFGCAYLGEVLYYNKALSDVDRDSAVGALKAKWGF